MTNVAVPFETCDRCGAPIATCWCSIGIDDPDEDNVPKIPILIAPPRRKGNVTAQKRRSRHRYRGCRVCGVRGHGEWCPTCPGGKDLVALHGHGALALIVDGGYEAYAIPGRRLQGRQRRGPRPGSAGAGLVLVLGDPVTGAIIASRSCQFECDVPTEAERQAVIRGARWAPGVRVFTDCDSIVHEAMRGSPGLIVEFLPAWQRGPAHRRAHELALEGRLSAAEARQKEEP